jgi:probable addiction module antidote protein
MTRKREYRDFKELLYVKLRDPKVAIAYLNEALANEDKKVFLLALKDVIEARGDITAFAEAAHMHRQNIYRMLSDEGNPTFDNLMSIFSAMNLKVSLSLA